MPFIFVRSVVDHYVSNGSTVNLCALDVSKAFDKMNHCGVFIKLMKHGLPVNILSVLEDWFSKCFICIKWITVQSDTLKLNFGVRQRGVLSPYLFSVYIDDIIETVVKQQIGCVYRSFAVSINLYADDILLLAPSN
jgi:Reverse transcriptase (RNA-dependent DNA polymerase)